MTFALQVVTSRDVQSLAIAGLIFVVAGVLAIIFRKRLKNLLTPTEWLVFLKLVAIVVMALLLVITSIAVEFPASTFIYGRF